MAKQLYTFKIEERNGDQEYMHDLYLFSESQEDANQRALAYAGDFYENASEIPGMEDPTFHAEENFTDIEWSIFQMPEPIENLTVLDIDGNTISVPVQASVEPKIQIHVVLEGGNIDYFGCDHPELIHVSWADRDKEAIDPLLYEENYPVQTASAEEIEAFRQNWRDNTKDQEQSEEKND